ncbi:MAG: nitroreductase family deazaflavin-dependent oxidoreductase [Candidatus Binatia bacterium]
MSESGARPFTPFEEKVGNVVIKYMSLANTLIYRFSGGRLGGRFLGGAPVCLLTTVGRKTGLPRTVPLLYLEDGRDLVVVASKGGMARNPLWFDNLVADPEVEVEIGKVRRPMTAHQASGEEKARLWPLLVAMYSSYADYQARTERDIPVVVLTPR